LSVQVGLSASESAGVTEARSSSACVVLRRMFDFSLLLSPSYLILCISAVLPFIGTDFSPFYRLIGVAKPNSELSECTIFVQHVLG